MILLVAVAILAMLILGALAYVGVSAFNKGIALQAQALKERESSLKAREDFARQVVERAQSAAELQNAAQLRAIEELSQPRVVQQRLAQMVDSASQLQMGDALKQRLDTIREEDQDGKSVVFDIQRQSFLKGFDSASVDGKPSISDGLRLNPRGEVA